MLPSVFMILALLALVLVVIHIIWPQVPVWIPVFLLVVLELLQALPRGG